MLDLVSSCATGREGGWLSRRAFLRIGALGLGSLTLANLLRLRAQGAVTGHKAVIYGVPAGRTQPSRHVRPEARRPDGGRGHWGRCYSMVLASAGIQCGIIHSRSDRRAAYPVDGAVSPQDLVTTIYHCLDIGAGDELMDSLGRPLKMCQGEPIQAVLA